MEQQEKQREQVERKKEFLIQVAFVVVWAAILWLVFKVAGSLLLPFVIAFLVAFVLAYPVDYVSKKMGWNRKIIAVITVLLFYGLLFCLFYFVGSRLLLYLWENIEKAAEFFSDTILPMIQEGLDKFENFLGTMGLGTELGAESVNNRGINGNKVGEMFSGISEKGMEVVSGMVTGIPIFLMQTLIAVIATIFTELEFHGVINFVKRQMPEKYRNMFSDGGKYMGGTMLKCARSYCLILGLTFVELLAGFLLLRVKGAVMFALIIALLDILPVLGTGTILIPWGVFALASGNVKMGAGIVAIYVIITVVRNIIEPKLVGKQMGLSPVVMLPSMLIGLKLFGLIGLFGVPYGIAFLKCLNDQGIIHIIKNQ